jgi:hypothetical protein
VSTRVVSWKDAAEMKLRVCSDALVMPEQDRLAFGLALLLVELGVGFAHLLVVDLLADQEVVSPLSVISTFCSIWRTITSMCLSLIFTPCSR